MVYFDPAEGMRPPPFVHSVFTALVVPRPIGWISTIGAGGVVNLAPFSYFNAVTGDPPCVMYCPNGLKPGTGEIKDSVANAEATGEFVFNLCTYDLREQMNATSVHAPADVDEMREAGLEPAPSEVVTPPRVAAAPVALECKYLQTVRLPKSGGVRPITSSSVKWSGCTFRTMSSAAGWWISPSCGPSPGSAISITP